MVDVGDPTEEDEAPIIVETAVEDLVDVVAVILVDGVVWWRKATFQLPLPGVWQGRPQHRHVLAQVRP